MSWAAARRLDIALVVVSLLLIAAVAVLTVQLGQPTPPCWMPEDMP
jgi:uncharacterized membrane protein